MKKRASLVYVLSRRNLIFITVYYTIIVLVALVALVWVMSISNRLPSNEILFYTGISSIAVSSMLCSIHYLKRLYKACIDMRINMPDGTSDLRQFGNILYFLLRPLYAIAFSVLAIFALLAGVIITTSVDVELNSRFLYLCVITSSIVGFSIGRVLDMFESLGDRKVREIAADLVGGNNDD